MPYVEVKTDRVIMKVIGIQGPQGPPGGLSLVTVTAGEALGGHRVIRVDSDGKAYYADNTISSHATQVVGITPNAISEGASGTVQTYGEMTEMSWSWTVGSPIYLSTNGLLTQTVPTSGFVLQLGVAISATKIFINIGMPVMLA